MCCVFRLVDFFSSCSVIANDIQFCASKSAECPHEQHNICLCILYSAWLSVSRTTAGSSSSSSFSSPATCSLTDCRQTSESHADNYGIELFRFCAWSVNGSNFVSNCWLHLSAMLSPILIADNVNIRPIFIIFHWKIHYSWLFWVNRGDNSIFLHCLTSVYSGLSFTR